MERKHPGHDPHQCEFMPIYEKHKRTMGDNWGLEGVERDTQKVYKYAKENFSRAKKNERNAAKISATPVTEASEPATDLMPDFLDKNAPIKREFPQPITPPDSDTAISPNKTLGSIPGLNQWGHESSHGHDQGLNGLNQPVLGLGEGINNHEFHLDWNHPSQAGFSFRSLLEDSTPWLNNNVKDAQIHYHAEKRPFEGVDQHHQAKVRRVERCTDPELKKLRCGIGGSYRFSLSKLHFNRVRCPYCVAPVDSNGKQTKVYIKAEYWRRHVTEVHSKPEEVAETKNLTICVTCYNQQTALVSDHSNSEALPDFDGLFRNQQEQQEHAQTCPNAEFASVWEKKESMPVIQPQLIEHNKNYGMNNYSMPYYQNYPATLPNPYQTYYRPDYTQSGLPGSFGFGQGHFQPLPDSAEGYDFYATQPTVQPTYQAAQTNVVQSNSLVQTPTPAQNTPAPNTSAPNTSTPPSNITTNNENKETKDKQAEKGEEENKDGKPRYNSIVFANEF